jgi:hypothetical protein
MPVPVAREVDRRPSSRGLRSSGTKRSDWMLLMDASSRGLRSTGVPGVEVEHGERGAGSADDLKESEA